MVTKILKLNYPHIITWAILLFLPFIGFLYQPQKTAAEFNWFFFETHVINISCLASIFYLNRYFIAPKYFFEKRRLKYTALIFLVFGVYVFINYLFLKFSPDTDKHSEEQSYYFFRLLIGPLIMYSLNLLTSTMMFLYEEQAHQKELNKLIEIEKTVAELNMLKLQISPHFLFNTLNNIRWLIRKKSEQSEESIMQLSEILRYIIYEVEGSKVEFRKEIEHLRNFIELQSLRLPIEGKVMLKVDEGIKNQLIEPLLFIHFAENAFKYGIDSKNSPDIQFEFSNMPNGIIFKAKNKILLRKTTVQNEGIGLSNIKRRLELLYPNKHQLTINQTEEYFEVNLKLELTSPQPPEGGL